MGKKSEKGNFKNLQNEKIKFCFEKLFKEKFQRKICQNQKIALSIE